MHGLNNKLFDGVHTTLGFSDCAHTCRQTANCGTDAHSGDILTFKRADKLNRIAVNTVATHLNVVLLDAVK